MRTSTSMNGNDTYLFLLLAKSGCGPGETMSSDEMREDSPGVAKGSEGS